MWCSHSQIFSGCFPDNFQKRYIPAHLWTPTSVSQLLPLSVKYKAGSEASSYSLKSVIRNRSEQSISPFYHRSIWEFHKHLWWSFFAKKGNGKPLTIWVKWLHHQYLTGSLISSVHHPRIPDQLLRWKWLFMVLQMNLVGVHGNSSSLKSHFRT